ncbi:MAG: glycosyltransferase [Gammaproteobacteria bacterium]|nr:glycosyltransferase [Gammaproteobacteria bacterium]
MENSLVRGSDPGTVEDILTAPTVENTCAVVVTYFPDDDVVSRLKKIQKQLPTIIIVDNASNEHCLSVLRKFSSMGSVSLVENEDNEGVGKALNQGASIALVEGFSWVLTLDQDTLISEDMFDTLAQVYDESGRRSPLIGSNYMELSSKRQIVHGDSISGQNFLEQKTVITSGMLVSLGLFRRIGGFREDYFIDSVDHEYCLRTRDNHFPVMISCKLLMWQTIGRPRPDGKRVLVFDHPPIRKYYMARNTIVTLREYFMREPVWALRQVIRLVVELVSIVLFEKDKWNKGYAFCRGIVDGIKNKMGRSELA